MGWTILTLVFLDELLVMAAFGVWGWHAQGAALAVVLPLMAMLVWWAFGSPKACVRARAGRRAAGPHAPSRASSSSMIAGSSLVKTGVGLATGVPGTIGVRRHGRAALYSPVMIG